MDTKERRTYKKEIAAITLGALYLLVGYTLYTLASASATDAMVSLVTVLILPTFATIAAAFGLDSYFTYKSHKFGEENE